MAPPVSYTGGAGGGGGETIIERTPNPTDAFRIALGLADINPALLDAMSVAFTFPETIPALSDAARFGLTFPDTVPGLADALANLHLTIGDSSPAVTDAAAFTLRSTYADTVAGQSDALAGLRLTGLGDTVPGQAEARSASAVFTGYATLVPAATNWTNPANAQGAPDTAYARLTDTVTGTQQGTLTATEITDPVADFASWTITKVEAVYWYQTTNTVGLDNFLYLDWQSGDGVWVQGHQVALDENFLQTGRVLDITAARAWTWAMLNGVQLRARYVSPTVTNTMTIDVNSFALRVTATKNPL